MDEFDATTTAVLAHALLNNLSLLLGGIKTLAYRGDQMDEAAKASLLEMLERQGKLMVEMLTDLARGVPAELWDTLDQLDAQRSMLE